MRFRKSSVRRGLGCVALAILAGGCSTVPFTVTAMRFHETEPRQQPFEILRHEPANTDGAPSSRLTDYVRTALLHHGFRAAAPGIPATMRVEISFEQEPPRTEIRTAFENITQWQPERIELKTKETKLPGGTVVRETVPTKVPAQTAVVGARTVTFPVKLFPKRLRIVGRDVATASDSETGRLLWSVEVRHDDEVRDPERFLVLMVAAAMNYLGDDFSGEKTVFLTWHDRQTRLILASTRS